MESLIRTVLPSKKGIYSSFPTFVCCDDRLSIFYRQARTRHQGEHGHRGEVHRLQFDLEVFLEAFNRGEKTPLCQLGRQDLVFSQGNEMDAVVSQLGNEEFSLATRTYDGRTHLAFFSLSDRPTFLERFPIAVPELEWFIPYGKALRHGPSIILPGYGPPPGLGFAHPVLLRSQDGKEWEFLCFPALSQKESLLNEFTLVDHSDHFSIFIRQDTPPFGIWHATSAELLDWTTPRKLFPKAHAPMAILWEGEILLAHRWIYSEDRASTRIVAPFRNQQPLEIEPYEGNIYDGGYADLAIVKDKVLLLYYHGNWQGEPSIKGFYGEPSSITDAQ